MAFLAFFDRLKARQPDSPGNTDEATAIPATGPQGVHLLSDAPVPAAKQATLLESVDESGVAFWLQTLLRNINGWFRAEIRELEAYARAKALSHADAGVPRLNADSEEIHEFEKELIGRATQFFLEWVSKITRRVQDGIQSASAEVNRGVVDLAYSISQAEIISDNIKRVLGERDLHEVQIGGTARVSQYQRHLGRVYYYFIMAVLLVVDWVANVPVFQELLPREASVDQALLTNAPNPATDKLFFGFHILRDRILYSPDVTFYAFGLILILLVACHACGLYLRRVVAFGSRKASPSTDMQAHVREAWVAFAISTIIISLALTGLYMSRAKLPATAGNRVAASTQRLQTLNAQINAASPDDTDLRESIRRQITDEEELYQTLVRREEFAKGIEAMNLPILLINCMLALTAAVSSYMHAREEFTDVQHDDPILARLQETLDSFYKRWEAEWLTIRNLDAEIRSNIAKVKYLAEALPLRGWQAQHQSIETTVRLFRTVNAERRGLDVHNILAFQKPITLPTPNINEDQTIGVPSDFPVVEAEFNKLRQQILALQRRTPLPTAMSRAA